MNFSFQIASLILCIRLNYRLLGQGIMNLSHEAIRILGTMIV